jgi:hypothetical protein
MGSFTNGNFFRYNTQAMEVLEFTEDKGKYVWERASSRYLKDFEDADRKVLVIGDSMGADFLNLMAEMDYTESTSFSFYTIQHPCGNLYLEESFVDQIDQEWRQKCINWGWYNNQQLRNLLHEADQVLLISLWWQWQVVLVNKSIENLTRDFGDKFLVVGLKSFGPVELEKISQFTLGQRLSYRTSPYKGLLELNEVLISELEERQFLDLGAAVCPDNVCRQFDDNGKLISYDGKHLTKDGAKYIGQVLLRNSLLREKLGQVE